MIPIVLVIKSGGGSTTTEVGALDGGLDLGLA